MDEKAMISVAQAAAGIADGVYSDNEAAKKLYDRVCDTVSGFPGIWLFVAECAVEVEKQMKDDELFIDLTEAIASRIQNDWDGKLPTAEKLVGGAIISVKARNKRMMKKRRGT